MTHRFLRFSIVCVALAYGTSASGADPQTKPLRFVFITCSVEGKFFEPVKKGMRDAAAAMGVECEFIGTQGVDLKAQAALVRRAVADGCDGIALNLIDPTAFDPAVAQAIEAGVPVVGFNVDDHATPNARLASVNQRLYDAGVSLGQHVAPHIPDHSHILMTMHDSGVSALDDRLRGEQDALKNKDVKQVMQLTKEHYR